MTNTEIFSIIGIIFIAILMGWTLWSTNEEMKKNMHN